MQKLLIIDDDKELCDLLKEYLTGEGYDLAFSHSGNEGLEKAMSGSFQLIILDAMLPELSGFEILRQLRVQKSIPVIMLTARGEEVDRIVGLELGADDYLAKPFSPRELVARIKAILRRSQSDRSHHGASSEILKISDLEMHVSGRMLLKNGERVALTEMEFHILEILLKNAGHLVKRQELAIQALGRHLTFDDRSLDVHISSIRKKLGNRVGAIDRVRTVRGEGYIYAAVEE
ncbi:MAG: response regulator transcription factor [Candidatus Riflebacteria bacterium]|nr:response regulator transcription factor [Candidatus Riflebacteria bacterium]